MPAPVVHVRSRIKECAAFDKRRHEVALKRRDGIAVHRIADAQDIVGLARAFGDTRPFQPGAYTGGELPYSVLVLPDGVVEQGLEIGDVGPHARRWNTPLIGVAALGDFRWHEPSLAQWQSAAVLCAWLRVWGGWGSSSVHGHDELPGGSADAKKKCPGGKWPMDAFRRDVDAHVVAIKEALAVNADGAAEFPLRAERALVAMGLVF